MKQHADLFAYISQQPFFFYFLFPLLDSGAVQYSVCQNKKMFSPHSLPQGLRLPVNRAEDRADNGKGTAEFPSLKITADEFFMGTVLKTPAGWDPALRLKAVVSLTSCSTFVSPGSPI